MAKAPIYRHRRNILEANIAQDSESMRMSKFDPLNQAPREKSKGAPWRIAAIGAGYWGRHVVRNIGELGALAAICDIEHAAAGPLAERYNVPILDIETVLADDSIEG